MEILRDTSYYMNWILARLHCSSWGNVRKQKGITRHPQKVSPSKEEDAINWNKPSAVFDSRCHHLLFALHSAMLRRQHATTDATTLQLPAGMHLLIFNTSTFIIMLCHRSFINLKKKKNKWRKSLMPTCCRVNERMSAPAWIKKQTNPRRLYANFLNILFFFFNFSFEKKKGGNFFL